MTSLTYTLPKQVPSSPESQSFMALEGHWLGSTIVRCGLWPQSVPWWSGSSVYSDVFVHQRWLFKIHSRYYIACVCNRCICMICSYIHIVYHIYVLICVDVSRHFHSSYAAQRRLTVVGWGSYLMELCVSISSEIVIISIYINHTLTKDWRPNAPPNFPWSFHILWC